MNHANAYKMFLLAAGLLATSSLALLSGCKNSTSAAALVGKVVGPPPTIQIGTLAPGASVADPMSDASWQGTQWYLLIQPTNTTHTTSQARAAMLYDADNLYVAFVNNKTPLTPAHDMVSIYLDTDGDGTEVAKIDVPSDGTEPTCTWIRSTVSAATREASARADGGLDNEHPTSQIPGVNVKGLSATVKDLTGNNEKVWTAVVTIPLQSLPLPVRANGTSGAKWKVNLLRTTITADTGSGSEALQSNLSPVYLGQQAICPYRMAEIVLGTNPQTPPQ